MQLFGPSADAGLAVFGRHAWSWKKDSLRQTRAEGLVADLYTVTKTFKFSAAHVLELLQDFDHPCSRLHGHNYEVAVVLAAPGLDDVGFVADTKRLDFFGHFVDRCLDHRNLNEAIPELGGQTTGENLAAYFYNWILGNAPETEQRPLRNLVSAVRVCETQTVCVEYRA